MTIGGGSEVWVRQAEANAGERHDRPSTELAEENRRLAKENAELRRANEILKAESTYYAWRQQAAQPCDRDLVDLALISNIYEIWAVSGFAYGADREAHFDIEHTFRMLKQTLDWTSPKLRDPAGTGRTAHAGPRPARVSAPARQEWQSRRSAETLTTRTRTTTRAPQPPPGHPPRRPHRHQRKSQQRYEENEEFE